MLDPLSRSVIDCREWLENPLLCPQISIRITLIEQPMSNKSVEITSVLIASCIGLLLAGTSSLAAAESTGPELWRLDCGEMIIDDISYFSDTHAYDGQSAAISNGCYLIRSGNKYLLWDAGLPHESLANTTSEDGWLSTFKVTVAEQLGQIGVKVSDIDFLGVSHFHGDHIGQAADFSHSTLLMNRSDLEWIRNRPPGNARRRLGSWFDGEGSIIDFAHDHDVFGDGTATILAMPGHTPGHSALLVRLPQTGYVLLTGDLFHFRNEIEKRNVSRWNTSRSETLASIERFSGIVNALKPIVVVQHDADDIDRLPAFPQSAR